jgi:hypothetical protein
VQWTERVSDVMRNTKHAIEQEREWACQLWKRMKEGLKD